MPLRLRLKYGKEGREIKVCRLRMKVKNNFKLPKDLKDSLKKIIASIDLSEEQFEEVTKRTEYLSLQELILILINEAVSFKQKQLIELLENKKDSKAILKELLKLFDKSELLLRLAKIREKRYERFFNQMLKES